MDFPTQFAFVGSLGMSIDSSHSRDDCEKNAIVREGRVWLPKQHHRLASPRSRGVGTPRVEEPLTTSLRRFWVSGNPPPGNGGTNEGAATLEPTKL